MRGKAAALLELAGVFIIGTLAARLTARALGVPAKGLRDFAPGETIDFLALAASTAANLLLRYGFILGLAFAIGWWLRRRRLAEYGVTKAGMPLREHVVIAVVMFAVGGFLPRLIVFFKDYLGETPAHWNLIDPQPTPGYWLYMAVGSFLLVPIVEELFARGYVQTRLGEDFGAPAAIVMTALMFTLSHRQYFLASAAGIGMLVALLFGALVGGYVRHRYGTLLPPILGHALGNVPYRGWVEVAVLTAMIVVIVLARTVIAAHLRDLAKLVLSREVLVPCAVAVITVALILGIAAISRQALLISAIVGLITAVLIERGIRSPA